MSTILRFKKKSLELVIHFSKDLGYNISSPKSIAFLYNNNKKLEIEILKNMIWYVIKILKYLGMSRTKYMPDPCTQNYKTL